MPENDNIDLYLRTLGNTDVLIKKQFTKEEYVENKLVWFKIVCIFILYFEYIVSF